MSSKAPFLNCENRIEDKNLRRIRQMARCKPRRLARQLDKPLETCEEGALGNGLFPTMRGPSES
jgi:hypothetical protein